MDDREERTDCSKHFPRDGNGSAKSEGTAGSTTGDLFATGRSATRLGFVLQFTESFEAEEFRGRVQDLVTSDGGNFSSPDTLIAILRRVLVRVRAKEREQSDE